MTTVSQTTAVVQAVEQMIASGEVGPGDRLPVESSLTERFGVSRSSLREGIRALVAMGVLETRQGSGTTVTSLDPGLLLDPLVFWAGLQAGESAAAVQIARRALEVEAVGLAATRVSPERLAEMNEILERARPAIQGHDHEAALNADLAFHGIIAEESGSPVLRALIQALSGPSVRGRIWASIHATGRLEATMGEHDSVYNALREGDAVAARAAMYTHLSNVAQHVDPESLVDSD